MRWLVLALVLVGHTAHAQAPGETEATHVEDKSLFTAYILSVGATTVPIAIGGALMPDDAMGPRSDVAAVLMLGGLTLGPSAGHWYAGSELLTTGLALRVLGAGVIISAAAYDPYLVHPSITVPGLVIGALAFEVGIGWDLVTLPRAVRRYNREHQITPVVTGNGVAIAGRF